VSGVRCRVSGITTLFGEIERACETSQHATYFSAQFEHSCLPRREIPKSGRNRDLCFEFHKGTVGD